MIGRLRESRSNCSIIFTLSPAYTHSPTKGERDAREPSTRDDIPLMSPHRAAVHLSISSGPPLVSAGQLRVVADFRIRVLTRFARRSTIASAVFVEDAEDERAVDHPAHFDVRYRSRDPFSKLVSRRAARSQFAKGRHGTF